MTYPDAVRVWYDRINFEVRSASPADLKLERMRAVLAAVGDPHLRLRTVHVTGTKGKGSTSAVLAAILRAAGYRVGLFTSPHLDRVEERMRVDDDPISADELAAGMDELLPAIQSLEPTFFEIGTALGFLHFVRRRVEVAVVEVGLGGRFDSTNVVEPLVSVVTSVGLDHTAQLGNTLEAIAFQKAGIIKRRVPVVSGVTQPGPREVVRRIAAEMGSPLDELGDGVRAEYEPLPPRAKITTPRRSHTWTPLALMGRHQAANAALAVATADRLVEAGFHIPPAAVAAGLGTVVWPARIEVIGRDPVQVIDSAHNVPSAEALVHTLAESVPVTGRKRCVFAVSNDKPFAEMLAVLAGYFDEFVFTRYASNPRRVSPEALVPLVPAGRVVEPAAAAWESAVAASGPADLVCATGSVFLAGELRAAIPAG